MLGPVRDYLLAGGPLMAPLALDTFAVWFLYFRLVGALRNDLRTPAIEEVLAAPAAESAGGVTPRLVRHLRARLRAGMPFREAFLQCRAAELDRFSYSFYVLGALVTAAPLMGLLGTVFGMIDTFDAVAARSEETASMVASGISEALITTQVGLAAALPGTFGLAHLMRLYTRLRAVVDHCESHLALVFEFGREGGR